MKSFSKLGLVPPSLALSADDILEFHAARILLLIKFSGTASRIDSLTKLAKLDFFARYPDFFEATENPTSLSAKRKSHPVESAMIRHHYGPWDKRYYHILASLEAKSLITISKRGKAFSIALTPLGLQAVGSLAAKQSFAPLVERMKRIKGVFGDKSGNYLKQLIYRLFDEEVGRRKLGEVIEP